MKCPGCGEFADLATALNDHDRAWHIECWQLFVESLDSLEAR
jgi:hypothetical protein